MGSMTANTDQPAGRKPPWLRVRAPSGQRYAAVADIIAAHGLHTVCESADCPNRGECWAAGTATMMILGGVCTRNCRFCNVPSGPGEPPDPQEGERVAKAVSLMGLQHVVLTCVTRDDLADGGAGPWARTIEAIRAACGETTIEVLTSDFAGRRESLEVVLAARPDIFAHNVETVPQLYPAVRGGADYQRSLQVLSWANDAGFVTKSSLMVGLGEDDRQVESVLRDLRGVGVRIICIGQYLRPSPGHVPIDRYVTPAQFDSYADLAREIGFEAVASAPLVRSSYHAERLARLVRPQ